MTFYDPNDPQNMDEDGVPYGEPEDGWKDEAPAEMTTEEGVTTDPKYPEVVVQLAGTDGNAFAVLGAVQRAMKKVGISKEERSAFLAEATNGDYDHLLRTCMRWVNVG